MRIPKILLTASLFFLVLSIQAQWSYNGTSIYYNGGNVGIGTTAPIYPLTINKVGEFAWNTHDKIKYPNLMVNGSNQTGGGIAISDDGGFFDWNDGYITFEPLCCASGLRVSKANFLVDNNIGIGTTNPQAALSLGAPGVAGKRLLVYDNGAARVQAGFGVDMSGTSRELSIFHSTSDGINGDISFGKRLENSGAYTEAMRITGTGKVGIGTVNTNEAGYKLFVETGIRTRKVKVDQSTWSDYVFYSNYRLRPLSEVEQYINQYHHLPEVPSAEEVEKNGLDVGDNQATLLKKIEELTLYIIQQNKRIEALESKSANHQ
jgi:hypothetical protein